jgi:hypothetical protein
MSRIWVENLPENWVEFGDFHEILYKKTGLH